MPAAGAHRHLTEVSSRLTALNQDAFSSESVKSAIWDYAEKEGRGNVLWPLRVALSGKEASAGPFEIAEILGKEKTLQRIQDAIDKLS